MKQLSVRENIIETASELFYHKGYNLTGINEIIKEAGIAKATLYNHFKSKEEICVAYIIFLNSRFLKDIGEYTNKKPSGTDQILGLFDFLDSFFHSKKFNGCWCINTISEIPKDNELIRAEIQNQKNKFIELIEQLVQNNLKNHSPHLAKKIYLIYESAISESHLHQEDWPIKAGRELCNSLMS